MRSIIIVAFAFPLAAQHITIGAIGGTSLSPDINEGQIVSTAGTQASTATYSAPAPRPILGLKLDFAFGRSWSLEVDALHREVRSTQSITFSPPLLFPDGREVAQFPTANRVLSPWEFPLLVKYRLLSPAARIRPVLMGGPSFRPAGNGANLSHVGVTAGGGVEFRAGSFRIEPQIRYTRWTGRGIGDTVGAPRLSQLEFVVGVDRPSSEAGPVSVFGWRVGIGVIAGLGLGSDFQVGSSSADQQ